MDRDSFERLYAEHAAGLLGFLAYRTGDRAQAEDLVSDTFERALRARFRFDRRKASEKTWIYSIALNCLRDNVRKQGAQARALGQAVPSATDDSAFAGVHDRDLVSQALQVLTPEEREAVALRFGADLSVPEIARLLQEPLTTIEGRVYRALRKMREELSPDA
jgi:RNA polymerase sigma-70 factor (ECF subfamily)